MRRSTRSRTRSSRGKRRAANESPSASFIEADGESTDADGRPYIRPVYRRAMSRKRKDTLDPAKSGRMTSTVNAATTTLPAEKLVRVVVTLDSPLDVKPSPLALHTSSKGPNSRKNSRQRQQQEQMDSGLWDTTISGTIPLGRLKTKALSFFLANDDDAAEKLADSYRLLSVDDGSVMEESQRLGALEMSKSAKAYEMVLLRKGMRSLDTGDARDMEKGPTNLEIIKATQGLKRAYIERVADPPYSMLEMQLQMRRIFSTLLESACKLQSHDIVVINLLIQTQERLGKKVDDFPELDQEKLKTLTDMGFSKRRAARVLAMTRQNVRNAAAWLLKYPRDSESPIPRPPPEVEQPKPQPGGQGTTSEQPSSSQRTGQENPSRATSSAGKRVFRGTASCSAARRGRMMTRQGFFSPHSPRVFAGSPLSQSPFVTGRKSTKEPDTRKEWDAILQEVLRLMTEFHQSHFVPHMGMMRSLIEMGFPEEQVENCLRLTGNKRGAALELLLAGKGKYAEMYERGLQRDNPVITAIFKQPVVQLALLRQKTVAALLNLLEAPMTLQIWMTDPEVNGFLGSVIRVFHAEKHHMDKDIEEAIAKLPKSPPNQQKQRATESPRTIIPLPPGPSTLGGIVPPAPTPTPIPGATPPPATSSTSSAPAPVPQAAPPTVIPTSALSPVPDREPDTAGVFVPHLPPLRPLGQSAPVQSTTTGILVPPAVTPHDDDHSPPRAGSLEAHRQQRQQAAQAQAQNATADPNNPETSVTESTSDTSSANNAGIVSEVVAEDQPESSPRGLE